MVLEIQKVGNAHVFKINDGEVIEVEKYKISTSESGETEVELKLKLDVSISSIQMSNDWFFI